MKKVNVAVVGASGAVGEEMIRILEENDFPVRKLVPLASARSEGQLIKFKGKNYKIKKLTEDIFEKEEIEIALFSAGGSISAHFAPFAAEAGAVVIDNTSYFRMQEDIPLVVPEVNPEDIIGWRNKGIISNPNCSTIQMVQVLKPLNDIFGIKRVDVATYQATSGAGKSAMEEMVEQMRDFFSFRLEDSIKKRFPHQIALNVIPHIDKFLENGYTKEEMKMANETKKIMHKNIEVSATCVRVPVLRGHSEALSIWLEKEATVEAVKEALYGGENIIIVDNPSKNEYPMPILAANKDETFVGRIRKDLYRENVFHLWIVADNLRVGAATNAVRIAQKWIENEII